VGRVVEISNHSTAPATFQLHGCEPNGIFGLSTTAGVLPAGLSAFVNLTFSPREPGNYYKRIHVLVANQAPLVMDVVGTGYTDKRRPMTLGLKQVHEGSPYIQKSKGGVNPSDPSKALEVSPSTALKAQGRHSS